MRNALALLALASLGCLPKAKINQRAVDEVYKGYEYLKSEDLERAEVAFNHALEFNPDFPEAWNGLGVIEFKRNRLDGAKQQFIRAIRINHDFAEGHNNLGLVYKTKGDFGSAEDEFTVALKVNPDFLDARVNLADTLLRIGLDKPKRRKDYWARARTQYLHLLEAAPKPSAYWGLAYMEYESKDFLAAEKDYRRAIEIEPRFMEALHGLCDSLVALHRCGEAATYCQKCLAVSPGVPECKQSLKAAEDKDCASGVIADPRRTLPRGAVEEAE